MGAEAPIGIFVYNRPDHTRRLLESLHRSPIFAESPVTVFCDGPKRDADLPAIERTRATVRERAPGSATIIERDVNQGLARSIIDGVTALTEEHGRVIVCEDDLVFSPHALDFLNRGLERYRDEPEVMHVAAYMYPVNAELPAAHLYREATCWGWATWDRAWRRFEPDAARLLQHLSDAKARHGFDIEGSMYFYEMLRQQVDGRIDSWAIRWYASMFRAGGLALHPGRSLVRNEGFDGTGVHCGKTDIFEVELTEEAPDAWPDEVSECRETVEAMIAYRAPLRSQLAPRRGLRRLASGLVRRLQRFGRAA
ncbi:MAG: glycosyltransferase family A protein [Geminicoccaceae bacterium]